MAAPTPDITRVRAAAAELYRAANDLLLNHAAYRSEAGEWTCECDACLAFRPLLEAIANAKATRGAS